MNKNLLRKCIDKLADIDVTEQNATDMKISYVMGILETLYEMPEQKQNIVPTPVIAPSSPMQNNGAVTSNGGMAGATVLPRPDEKVGEPNPFDTKSSWGK